MTIDRTKALEAAQRIEDPDVDTGTIHFVADAKRCARALLAEGPGEREKNNSAAAGAAPLVQAARDVLAERRRHITEEGWTPEHDAEHANGEMAQAAAAYAIATSDPWHAHRGLWPWGGEWWKPRSYRENLVRAGALILAEIERLDHAAGDVSGGNAGITQAARSDASPSPSPAVRDAPLREALEKIEKVCFRGRDAVLRQQIHSITHAALSPSSDKKKP